MRIAAIICCSTLLFSASLTAQTTPPAGELLQRGKESFRAGNYAAAVDDLRTAAGAFLSPEQKQQYIETGKLQTLPQLEESLVFLAVAYSKLGKEAEARDAVVRLLNAERITPTYATLPLTSEVAEIEPLVARVIPTATLARNVQLAAGGAPAPATQIAVATPAQPVSAPTATTPAATGASTASTASVASTAPAPSTMTPTPQPAAPAAVVASAQTAAPAPAPATSTLTPEQRAEMLRMVEERVAEARAEIEREANAKISQVQREADERVAREKKAADERIATECAAVQKAADERIAAERAAVQKAADERIAAEREAARRAAEERLAQDRNAYKAATQERIAEERVAAKVAVEQQVAAERDAAQNAARGDLVGGLRQAESAAASGRTAEANRIYTAIANTPAASREAIAAAATGLYRIGAFEEAVAAFERVGQLARGEEDLRYYRAVALFETGRYRDAQNDLSCALPYIESTPDVERYEAKIIAAAEQQASVR